MTKLSVNVNKIALLRNARTIGIPSVVDAAETAILAGAHGITVHPRPDERHIRYSDVYEIKDICTVEFNIEGNPFTGRYMDIVAEVQPAQATLVPDEPGASTSDHGWNLERDGERVRPVIEKLKSHGVRVSLFMDPEPKGIEIAAKIGADRIELYTEPYATAHRTKERLEETLRRFVEAGRLAGSLGLGLNAGHDLNLANLGIFCSSVPGVQEVSIGHALVADALDMGLYNTVKAYLKVLSES